MPCPYFEPHHVASRPHNANARLPLIDEYDGLCQAACQPVEVPEELRFRCCNHGYSRGCCDRFPSGETRCSLRYSVLRHCESTLDLVCIEEQNYAPLASRQIHYCVTTGRLEPEIDDACVRAQAVAFCRSYLARFA